MPHVIRFYLWPALFCCCGSLALVSAGEVKRDVAFDTPRLWEVAAELSRGYEFRVCSESTFSTTVNPSRFTIDLDAVTQTEALDHFVIAYSNYTYHIDETNEIINIYPKGISRLERRVQSLSISNMTVHAIFEAEDIFGLKRDGINYFHGRGNITWLDKELSLELHEHSLREALNLICLELPFEARWDVLSLRKGGRSTLLFQRWQRQPLRPKNLAD